MQFSIKYRPQKFSEVVGQPVATRILSNSIKMGQVPAALALFGMYGCGKTTLARIYAKALNCSNFDGEPCGVCESCKNIQSGTSQCVLEYDAASHSGVDDAREFEELVSFSASGAYRVIILDECHMLTKAAQSVLLKLLEEPREKTLFVLVTTEVSKLEDTVLSRCLRVDLRPIGVPDIEKSIRHILSSEGVTFTEGFLAKLAQNSTGALRDTQQVLEQLVLQADGALTEETLDNALGLTPTKVYRDLAYLLNTRNVSEFLSSIRSWYVDGVDLSNLFMDGVPRIARDFILCLSDAEVGSPYSGISLDTMRRNLTLTYKDVKSMLELWGSHWEIMKSTVFPKIVWETFAVSYCDG